MVGALSSCSCPIGQLGLVGERQGCWRVDVSKVTAPLGPNSGLGVRAGV